MIVFSGLDGAGKSTQIDLLKTYFKNNHSKVKLFWSRGGYTPGMQFLKDLIRISKKSKTISDQSQSRIREKSFSNPFIRKIWLSAAIIDLLFFYALYLRIKSIFGYNVICDRYIIDTQIDFKLNFPQENIEKWLLWKILLIFSKKPKKHFVITIPVNESIKRSALKHEPFPDSEEILALRLKEYLDFTTKKPFAIHISGIRNMYDIHKFIKEEIST